MFLIHGVIAYLQSGIVYENIFIFFITTPILLDTKGDNNE